MRTKVVQAKKRYSQPSPTAIKLHAGKCLRWKSKNRGIQLVEKIRVYKLARISGMLGESLVQLSERIGVPRHILGQWMCKDPKIQKSFEDGMDVMDVDVEQAARKRACGYDEPRTTVSIKRGIDGRVIEKTTTKQNIHIPGDPSMQRYLLDRRNKKRFAKEESAPAHIILQIDGDDDQL